MADITFSKSITIIYEAMIASLQELLKLSNAQMTEFVNDFESHLPEYLQKALHPEVKAA